MLEAPPWSPGPSHARAHAAPPFATPSRTARPVAGLVPGQPLPTQPHTGRRGPAPTALGRPPYVATPPLLALFSSSSDEVHEVWLTDMIVVVVVVVVVVILYLWLPAIVPFIHI